MGSTCCGPLRARQNKAAVLILTARGSAEDKVRGLDLGADDYMIKPFDVREFEARVRVLLRRQAGLRSSLVTFGPLSLDLTSRTFSARRPDARSAPAGDRTSGGSDHARRQGGVEGRDHAVVDRFRRRSERQCDRAICQPAEEEAGRLWFDRAHRRGIGYYLERQTPDMQAGDAE